ncbi:MAG: endonuclease MutS2 [Bacillota bacterium]
MDERVLRRLEFDMILDRLAGYAESSIGRELALHLRPVTDIAAVKLRLAQTAEAREVLRREPGFGLSGWYDIRNELKRVLQGGVLEARELQKIAETLAVIRRVKAFFKERGGSYPLLREISDRLTPFRELEERLKKCIRPPDEVADAASPRLTEIRRRTERLRGEIKETLEYYLRSPAWQKWLQEPLVTIREGRYVLPVKIEYREKVDGLVHDQSASGATLFIEPMAVVGKGNEIRRLKAAEQREIERILGELSAAVGAVAEEILISTEILGRLDFTMAKGRYSAALDGLAPVILNEPRLEFKKARHPLLGPKAVPIDVALGKDFDILIITGPNTGGKTVALKTVGLFVLMVQSGLEVPVAEGSEVGVFEEVFADIGDEQSVTESLSTFSSHMRNITGILEKAGGRSLVLLDELGAGTDPKEGAALACAILEELERRATKTIATTHSGELKEFAAGRPRVENASVDFDPETLSPTFRLVIGQPGRSNAFEIARGLGLPAELAARAREFLSPDERRLHELANEMERARRKAEAEAAEASRLRDEAASLKAEYENRLNQLLSKKEQILAEARESAASAVLLARREAEAVIHELRERIKSEERKEQEMAVQAARERLRSLSGRYAERSPFPKETPASLEPGDTVYVLQFGQEGTVVDIPREGTVSVQVGSFRVDLPSSSVKPVPNRRFAGGVRFTGTVGPVSSTVDLRGRRVEEALQELEQRLDAALLSGLGRVDIIHGYGTGALRTAVKEYLSGHPRVKSYRAGGPGEGGGGVTVAELE